jgi:hypothetical protein
MASQTIPVNFKTVAISLLLAAVLCACATPGKSQFSILMDKWVGRSADQLVIRNGPPEEVFSLDSGGKVYSYLKSQLPEGNSDTRSDMAMEIWKHDVEMSIIQNSDAAGAIPQSPVLSQDYTGVRPRPYKQKKNTCKLLFTISATNIIESWSTEGEGCE